MCIIVGTCRQVYPIQSNSFRMFTVCGEAQSYSVNYGKTSNFYLCLDLKLQILIVAKCIKIANLQRLICANISGFTVITETV